MRKPSITFFITLTISTLFSINAAANTDECQNFSDFSYNNTLSPSAGTGIVTPLSSSDIMHPAFLFYVHDIATLLPSDYHFHRIISPPQTFPTYLRGHDTYSVAINSSALPNPNPVLLALTLINISGPDQPDYSIEVVDSNDTAYIYSSPLGYPVSNGVPFTLNIPLYSFPGFQNPVKAVRITHAPIYSSKIGLVKVCAY